jgi:superfamily I DNA/RNA helicase
VGRLLSEGVPGKSILLLSFTRTAASDLRDKIAALNVPEADQVQALTIHSYCFQVLNQSAVLIATKRKPRTLLSHEADLMLRDISGDFGDLDSRRTRLEAFQAGWLRETTDHPGLVPLPSDREFERRILQWLRHHEAMLIGEVIPLAFKYLHDNPAAPELRKFHHIIVDEYQDLNHLEQHLLNILSSQSETSLCIAGDEDQSIYGFRYANPSGILDFQRRTDVEKHEINVCGRCPQIVLSMANSLISHASERSKPALMSNHPEKGNVAIIQWQDQEDEIEGIATAIIADINNNRRLPGDILVLTNRSQIGTAIRCKLEAQNIPAKSFFSEEALKNTASKDAFALLQLVCGEDKVALRVLLGSGDASGRTNAYKRLAAYSYQNNLTEREVLDRLVSGERIENLSIPALVSRYQNTTSAISRLQTLSLENLVDEIFPETNSELTEIRKLAKEYLPKAMDVDDFLKLLTHAITQVDVPQNPDFVRIMSLHKSKGLTSQCVFVMGFVQGIIPTLKANLTEIEINAAIEEQRRLLYVALTRAAEQLVISSSISIELSKAFSMNVDIDRKTIRRVTGGKRTARTIASTYNSELGPDAPTPILGNDWLETY